MCNFPALLESVSHFSLTMHIWFDRLRLKSSLSILSAALYSTYDLWLINGVCTPPGVVTEWEGGCMYGPDIFYWGNIGLNGVWMPF